MIGLRVVAVWLLSLLASVLARGVRFRRLQRGLRARGDRRRGLRRLGWGSRLTRPLAILTLSLGCVAATATHAGEAEPEDDAQDAVTIGADEVADRTVMLGAETVRIEGTVEGDLVVSAQSLVVTGIVRGNVIAMAEEVEIQGGVEGAVQCLCREVSISGLVAGNVYVLGETLVVSPPGRIGRDVLGIVGETRIDGEVSRDLWLQGGQLELTGAIGRHLRAELGELRALPGARIGGDTDVVTPDLDAVQISPEAEIGGQLWIEQDEDIGRPKHAQPGWYVWQIVQLAGAFVVGLILLRLFPAVMTVELGGPKRFLVYAGIGLLLLLLTPIASVVAAATIIGLPLGIIAMVVYAIALYLSGIVVAARLGQTFLPPRKSSPVAALFLGLLLLAVVTALPFIGGIISFIVLVLGLGIIHRTIKATRPAMMTES